LSFDTKRVDFTKYNGIGKSLALLTEIFFNNISNDIDSKIVYQSVITSCGSSIAKTIVSNGINISDIYSKTGWISTLRGISGFNKNVIEQLQANKYLIKEICSLRNVVDNRPKQISIELVNRVKELIDEGKIKKDKVDWLCCHYSSEVFKKPIQDLMEKGGGAIAEEKWFNNLASKGNTGAASIFIMLEELMYSNKLKQGDIILCMVPESGRFITSFMQLKVETPEYKNEMSFPYRKVETPELNINKNETSEWLIRQLAQIWIDFETELLKVPIVAKIHAGKLSLEDYNGSPKLTKLFSNI
jgi:hypothetical protein